jgi:hypothetical protein
MPASIIMAIAAAGLLATAACVGVGGVYRTGSASGTTTDSDPAIDDPAVDDRAIANDSGEIPG